MKSKKNIAVNDNILKIYGKGILTAYVFLFIIFIVMALLITYTSISEGIIPMMASIAMIMGSATGGMYVGAKQKKKGWVNGGIIGVIYMILIILMSWLFVNGFSIDLKVLIKGLFGILSGGIGGMIGVNLK